MAAFTVSQPKPQLQLQRDFTSNPKRDRVHFHFHYEDALPAVACQSWSSRLDVLLIERAQPCYARAYPILSCCTLKIAARVTTEPSFLPPTPCVFSAKELEDECLMTMARGRLVAPEGVPSNSVLLLYGVAY